MEKSQLYIPKRIKVGYDERDDTYTKKLAYVIYFDDKGVLRKETSWENWRNKKIEPNEYDNIPTEGFVLNKGVGGQRESYGWNARNEYIRVYDPRGFEFEISVANLLYILQEATSTKGKGLEGEFIYSWEGKELVLLPVDSAAYKNSQEYTKLQGKKVSTKELVAGCVYRTKKQEELIYLGKFDYYTLAHINKNDGYYDRKITKSKLHIFLPVESENEETINYVIVASPSNISECINDIPVSNYAELLENYNKNNIRASKPLSISLVPKKFEIETNKRYSWGVQLVDPRFYVKIDDTTYRGMSVNMQNRYNGSDGYGFDYATIEEKYVHYICKDGVIETKEIERPNYNRLYDHYNRVVESTPKKYTLDEILAMEVFDLVAELENGEKITFSKYGI